MLTLIKLFLALSNAECWLIFEVVTCLWICINFLSLKHSSSYSFECSISAILNVARIRRGRFPHAVCPSILRGRTDPAPALVAAPTGEAAGGVGAPVLPHAVNWNSKAFTKIKKDIFRLCGLFLISMS